LTKENKKMGKITFDYSKAASFVSAHEMEYMKKLALDAKEQLLSRTGAGNDFLGWIDLPVDYDKEEFARIKEAAKKIQSDSDVLLVIVIGGSYLGARAAIEFLGHSFYNVLGKDQRKTPEIYFCGNSISSTYLKHLIDVVGDRDFSVNMISKSGTTTEPAIAFRVFKEILEKKYGKEGAAKRIYATTDKARGALKTLADAEGYETFVIPDDVGGRFSVLTAVGLLPIAVAGCDIDAIMEGAKEAYDEYKNASYEENDCYKYAAARNAMYNKGKAIEMLVNYEPQLHYITEWWKQLY
jgi:glucose-6-phosphate isomerase